MHEQLESVNSVGLGLLATPGVRDARLHQTELDATTPVEDVMAVGITNSLGRWGDKSSNRHADFEFVSGCAPLSGQGGFKWRTLDI